MEYMENENERPKEVVVSRILDRVYATVNFGIAEKESGDCECYSVTWKYQPTMEEVVSTLRANGTLHEMRREELLRVAERLECESVTGCMRMLVESQIRAYDKSDDVNSFTYGERTLWFDKDTRMGLVNACNMRERLGYEDMAIEIGGEIVVMGIADAMDMLARMEVYANHTYIVTATHLEEIKTMGLDGLVGYDERKGYAEEASC